LIKCKPILNTFYDDNGKEYFNHKIIGSKLSVDFYFARAHHPWKCGLNKNCNRLVRFYFSKGAELAII
jgi:IS30 family transposase